MFDGEGVVGEVGNPSYGAGIGCLGEGLQVEAVCEDGQIEAVSVKGAKAFALGVQWHPEYRYWENPQYNALIGAFHEAAREYQAGKMVKRREAVDA